jgi:hypothetical protein
MLSEFKDESSIPLALAGVVLVSGAAFVPLNVDCIKPDSSEGVKHRLVVR